MKRKMSYRVTKTGGNFALTMRERKPVMNRKLVSLEQKFLVVRSEKMKSLGSYHSELSRWNQPKLDVESEAGDAEEEIVGAVADIEAVVEVGRHSEEEPERTRCRLHRAEAVVADTRGEVDEEDIKGRKKS